MAQLRHNYLDALDRVLEARVAFQDTERSYQFLSYDERSSDHPDAVELGRAESELKRIKSAMERATWLGQQGRETARSIGGKDEEGNCCCWQCACGYPGRCWGEEEQWGRPIFPVNEDREDEDEEDEYDWVPERWLVVPDNAPSFGPVIRMRR